MASASESSSPIEVLEDYLPEDPPIPGQRWVAYTIVGPNAPQKTDVWAIKVRGVWGCHEVAQRECAKILERDPDFGMLLTDVGKFAGMDMNAKGGFKPIYPDERLNRMMATYHENNDSLQKEVVSRVNAPTAPPLTREMKCIYATTRLTSMEAALKDAQKRLAAAIEEYDTFTDKEKDDAKEVLKKATGGKK